MITYKSRVAGPYHIDNNIPCQDSWAVNLENTSFSVVAVADGLGSELFSDVGSSVASKIAVDYVSENIKAGMSFDEIKKLINNSFVHAYKAVLARAETDGNDPDEYDTTLCLAVYNGEKLYYGQSGDSGMVALLATGDYLRVTSQQRDEEGRVFPLCFGPEKWEFGVVDSKVCAVMLMTDGVFEQICPPLLRNKEVDVNVSLAQRFLDKFECTDDEIPEMEKMLDEYLANYPRYLLDDDKTLVVMINTESRPERKDESYYAIPDWEALQNEAERKLAANSNEDLAVMSTRIDLTRGYSVVTSTEDTNDEGVITNLNNKESRKEGIEIKVEDEHVDVNHAEVEEDEEKSKKKDLWEPF